MGDREGLEDLERRLRDSVENSRNMRSQMFADLQQLRHDLASTRSLEVQTRSKANIGHIVMKRDCKELESKHASIMKLLQSSQSDFQVGTSSSGTDFKMLDDGWKPEGIAMFNTLEEKIRFFATNALKSYNAQNADAGFVLEEAIMCNNLVSEGSSYNHINFTARDKEGSVHFFFAETSCDDQSQVLACCILDGQDGDYSRHQRGCGGCDPNARVPVYHPYRGYTHGDYLPYSPRIKFNNFF